VIITVRERRVCIADMLLARVDPLVARVRAVLAAEARRAVNIQRR
jgi:hypothetical protein